MPGTASASSENRGSRDTDDDRNELGRFVPRGRIIPYHPEFGRLTGDVHSALLLRQIIFWWKRQREKPFYKFKEPCTHKKYLPGDSWCEELRISPAVFDTALTRIATKITKGVAKTPIREDQRAKFDDRARMINAQHLVLHHTEGNRLTYYELNVPLLQSALETLKEIEENERSVQQGFDNADFLSGNAEEDGF